MGSAKEMEAKCQALAGPFAGKETEENWYARAQSFTTLRKLLRGEENLHDVALRSSFLHALKHYLVDPILISVLSNFFFYSR